ncbi:hypothetical protein DFH06DRAFT_220057 [Mycena polygramma]|nr:hypothetical protein DFH06DRAFT_220057 [Mycena polygramma]
MAHPVHTTPGRPTAASVRPRPDDPLPFLSRFHPESCLGGPGQKPILSYATMSMLPEQNISNLRRFVSMIATVDVKLRLESLRCFPELRHVTSFKNSPRRLSNQVGNDYSGVPAGPRPRRCIILEIAWTLVPCGPGAFVLLSVQVSLVDQKPQISCRRREGFSVVGVAVFSTRRTPWACWVFWNKIFPPLSRCRNLSNPAAAQAAASTGCQRSAHWACWNSRITLSFRWAPPATLTRWISSENFLQTTD